MLRRPSTPLILAFRPKKVIFDAQTGERVAHLYKYRWSSFFRGWAPDSSGAYFELIPKGTPRPRNLVAHPIYKLLVPGAERGPKVKRMPLPDTAGQIGRIFIRGTIIPPDRDKDPWGF